MIKLFHEILLTHSLFIYFITMHSLQNQQIIVTNNSLCCPGSSHRQRKRAPSANQSNLLTRYQFPAQAQHQLFIYDFDPKNTQRITVNPSKSNIKIQRATMNDSARRHARVATLDNLGATFSQNIAEAPLSRQSTRQSHKNQPHPNADTHFLRSEETVNSVSLNNTKKGSSTNTAARYRSLHKNRRSTQISESLQLNLSLKLKDKNSSPEPGLNISKNGLGKAVNVYSTRPTFPLNSKVKPILSKRKPNPFVKTEGHKHSKSESYYDKQHPQLVTRTQQVDDHKNDPQANRAKASITLKQTIKTKNIPIQKLEEKLLEWNRKEVLYQERKNTKSSYHTAGPNLNNVNYAILYKNHQIREKESQKGSLQTPTAIRKPIQECLIGVSKILENKGPFNSQTIQTTLMQKQEPSSVQFRPIQSTLLSNILIDSNKAIVSEATVHDDSCISPLKKSTNAREFMLKRKFTNKKDHFVFSLDKRVPMESNIPIIKIEASIVQSYRDFLWKINFSNGLFVQPPDDENYVFRVYVGPGNNSVLVKGILKRRSWWVIVDKIDENTNFVWTQLKINQFFDKQDEFIPKNLTESQCAANVVQENNSTAQLLPGSSSNTSSSVDFQRNRCQTAKKLTNESQKTTSNGNPHQNIFCASDLQAWSKHYEKNKQLEDELNQKVYAKRAPLLQAKNATKLSELEKLRMHNHFKQNYFIGNKKAMYYCLRKYYGLIGKNVFDYLPLTFHVTKGTSDPQFKQFMKYYDSFRDIRKTNKNFRNVWIVKPGQFTNRGKGITVCDSLEDIQARLLSKEKNADGKLRTFIIQKYIQRPLLYNRRKFDIRHYMMMCCINGTFKGYWYDEGYIRTSSAEFNIKNCKDSLTHLTNDAVQKYSQSYGKYQKGNKISYAQFQKYLDSGPYKVRKSNYFYQIILPQCKNIATDAIKASYSLLDSKRKTHNFEIFGLDFMIDEDFRPWLIEINTNPCLELSCPLLARIIPCMLENTFKIGLDPIFQPPYCWPGAKKYQLGDNPVTHNKYTLIFDEQTEGSAIQQLYANEEKIDKDMGEIQQQDQEYEDEGGEWHDEPC